MNKAQILVLIQLILFVVIGASAVLIPSNKSTEQWIIGGGLILLGLAVAFWAIFEHGRVNRGGPSALPPLINKLTLSHQAYTSVSAIQFIQVCCWLPLAPRFGMVMSSY